MAVVGASPNADSLGRRVFDNVREGGFKGDLYPVHPTAKDIAGFRAFGRVTDIPGPVDLAVLVVPAKAVLQVAEDCARKGVTGLVVISAGFRESGREGAEREAALRDLVRRHGMRMVGPNCLGIINMSPAVRLNASFAPTHVENGTTALVTQSGALGVALLEHAAQLKLGIGRFASMGNKVDVSGNDLLLLWDNDPEVKQILMYLESFGNPRNFIRIARSVGRRKPILVVKSGRSAAGARAAQSHTGAMAEQDRLVGALFEQCGVLRVQTVEELFDTGLALALQPLPAGPRVAIVTNSGGPAIMAVDALPSAGLDLADLTPVTLARLSQILPEAGFAANPVDLLAGGGPTQFGQALDTLLSDPGVDACVAICTPLFGENEAIARELARSARGHPEKTVLTVIFGRGTDAPGFETLLSAGLPVYTFAENAVRVLGDLHKLASFRRRPEGRLERRAVDQPAARAALAGGGRPGGWLTQADGFRLLQAYGIPTVAHSFAPTRDEAVAAARRIGFPVVLKAEAPGLVHKTEAHAVRLGLEGPDAVRRAWDEMTASLKAAGHRPDGFVVMAHAAPGFEAIVGATQDPKFGPAVVFGLGGIHAEYLQDFILRLAPLTDLDARAMIRGLRTFPLLQGARGAPPVDLSKLEDLLLRVGQLVSEFPEVLELDLNPLRLYAAAPGALALDVRVRVAGPGGTPQSP